MSPLVLLRVRAGAVLLLAGPLLAQAPPAATPVPTPRPGVTAAEEVTVLLLDVVAVDGKNRPVFGLVAADFEVRVAGKVQTIDSFEPPRELRGPTAAKEGRPDSEERIAGTTTAFEQKGPVRHVLVWVDLEQLPRISILDTAKALHQTFDHAPSGRYGFATHFGGTSARVWDADSVDSFLFEADRMSAEVVEDSGAALQTAASAASSRRGMEAPHQYEARKQTETQLIGELIAIENANGDTRQIFGAISQYLAAERRRVRSLVEDLLEAAQRFSALDGPRHLFYVSEGFERVPGFNFLARLKAEESANVMSPAGSAGGVGAPTTGRGRTSTGGFPAIPGAPGSSRDLGAGRFAFDSVALLEADDLTRFLATSGVILHFIDPGSAGRGLISAADKYSFSSTLRQDEARNLQDAPMRYVDATGGIARVSTNDTTAALEGLLDATAATYRLGVRLSGVDPKKTYSVKVAARKAGVNMLARSAFKPAGPPSARSAAALAEDARHAGVAARADEQRPGAARTAKKPIPVTLEWKGRASTPSPDLTKPFWKLEVRIPHEELRFETESDAFVASVRIAVETAAVDGPTRDATTDDWFLSYAGDEYKAVRDTPASRLVTLQLPPGRYDLTVSVNDALGGTFGQATLRVDAR